MDPAASYDSWYDSPRGRWIGETEYRLISRQLCPLPGEFVLDAGCGTGWFSRRFFLERLCVAGLDKNLDWLRFSGSRSPDSLQWIGGDLRCLPFRDRTFDRVFSVAALCFVDDEREAVRKIVRVTRRRFVIGWPNRDSLLYRQKRVKGEIGSYRGTRWHRPGELPDLFTDCGWAPSNPIPASRCLKEISGQEFWSGSCRTIGSGALSFFYPGKECRFPFAIGRPLFREDLPGTLLWFSPAR